MYKFDEEYNYYDGKYFRFRKEHLILGNISKDETGEWMYINSGGFPLYLGELTAIRCFILNLQSETEYLLEWQQIQLSTTIWTA